MSPAKKADMSAADVPDIKGAGLSAEVGGSRAKLAFSFGSGGGNKVDPHTRSSGRENFGRPVAGANQAAKGVLAGEGNPDGAGMQHQQQEKPLIFTIPADKRDRVLNTLSALTKIFAVKEIVVGGIDPAVAMRKQQMAQLGLSGYAIPGANEEDDGAMVVDVTVSGGTKEGQKNAKKRIMDMCHCEDRKYELQSKEHFLVDIGGFDVRKVRNAKKEKDDWDKLEFEEAKAKGETLIGRGKTLDEKSHNSTFGGGATIGNKKLEEEKEKAKKKQKLEEAKALAAALTSGAAAGIGPGGVPLAPPVIPGLTPGTVPGALPVVPPQAVPGSFGLGLPGASGAPAAAAAAPAAVSAGAGLAPPGPMPSTNSAAALAAAARAGHVAPSPSAVPGGAPAAAGAMDVDGGEYKAVMPTALPSEQNVALPAGSPTSAPAAAPAAGAVAGAPAGSSSKESAGLGAFGISGAVVPGARQPVEIDAESGRVIPPSNASSAQVEYKKELDERLNENGMQYSMAVMDELKRVGATDPSTMSAEQSARVKQFAAEELKNRVEAMLFSTSGGAGKMKGGGNMLSAKHANESLVSNIKWLEVSENEGDYAAGEEGAEGWVLRRNPLTNVERDQEIRLLSKGEWILLLILCC